LCVISETYTSEEQRYFTARFQDEKFLIKNN